VKPGLFLLSFAAFAQPYAGSKACAPCHAEIAARYAASPMARTSGIPGSGPFTESMDSPSFRASGARYAVRRQGADLEFTFSRAAQGARRIAYFFGSGKVGRSYAFRQGEFLFQAPVSYFSTAKKWGLSPGYDSQLHVDLAKPIEGACLNCHATQPQPLPHTRNAYADPPFLEPGVGCERCHGSADGHIKAVRQGRAPGPIVNPSRLSPARRDSVCQQCHLTGAERVAIPGKTYQPGDLLSDSLAVFIYQGGRPGLRTATDHAEQFAQSRCRQAAGDKLWCGTCHDAHGGDTPKSLNSACQNCHTPTSCPQNSTGDCSSCHMAKSRSREGAHVAFTDHRILRRPAPQRGPSSQTALLPFWSTPPGPRETALAFAAAKDPRARDLLEKVPSPDAEVLVQLAQIHDALRESEKAIPLYERALKLDPSHPTTAANLAIYKALQGDSSEAAQLWEDAFTRDPANPAPALNLIRLYQATNQPQRAARALQRLQQFHPDHPQIN
jgi:hypothetical protein